MNKIFDFKLNNNRIDNDYILKIEEMCKTGVLLSIEDVEALLSNLAYEVRKRIADYEKVDMNDYAFSYKCDLAQSIMFYYLNSLGINVNPVNTNDVIEGVVGHSFVLATFNTNKGIKQFLIDPTYIQFFDKDKCTFNSFVVIKNQVCISADPGFFIVNNNTQKTIMPLLENGYSELTLDVAKAYGDSFHQTKQGTYFEQIDNYKASGLSYIKWFNGCKSSLSKTEEELDSMGLLINSSDFINPPKNK